MGGLLAINYRFTLAEGNNFYAYPLKKSPVRRVIAPLPPLSLIGSADESGYGDITVKRYKQQCQYLAADTWYLIPDKALRHKSIKADLNKDLGINTLLQHKSRAAYYPTAAAIVTLVLLNKFCMTGTSISPRLEVGNINPRRKTRLRSLAVIAENSITDLHWSLNDVLVSSAVTYTVDIEAENFEIFDTSAASSVLC